MQVSILGRIPWFDLFWTIGIWNSELPLEGATINDAKVRLSGFLWASFIAFPLPHPIQILHQGHLNLVLKTN